MENGGYVVNHNIEFASTGWEIRGTGDFDGDGDDDIVWHHRGDGGVVASEMENNAYIATTSRPPAAPGTSPGRPISTTTAPTTSCGGIPTAWW